VCLHWCYISAEPMIYAVDADGLQFAHVRSVTASSISIWAREPDANTVDLLVFNAGDQTTLSRHTQSVEVIPRGTD